MDIASYLLPDPTLLLIDTIEVEASGGITLVARSTPSTSRCPVCHHCTERVHSHYQRTLADLPWADLPVCLRLEVRRFVCSNPTCERIIFCERLPTVAVAWARRTQRLARAQEAIGLTAGGAGGARLCAALSMEAGVDLLLHLLRRMPLPEAPTPTVLGVDDWAKRKGQSYGTILIDLERGTVVDLLADRTADTLAEWLFAHPGVEIISRDRAGAYAEGARAGAPQAIQVADRWHLLKNLSDALYKVLQPYQREIEQQMRALLAPNPVPSDDTTPPAPLESKMVPIVTEQPPDLSAADQRRQQRIETVHQLHQCGWTGKDIAAHLNVHPKTVSRDLMRSLPLAPLRRERGPRLLDAYQPYLLERWQAGCHNAKQLFGEIQTQGFQGQLTTVRMFVATLRAASGLPPGGRSPVAHPLLVDPTLRLPSLRTLAHLITGVPAVRDDREKRFLDGLSQVHPSLAEAVRLGQAFAAMVRQRRADDFDGWLADATGGEVAPLRSFALGLQRDDAAVRAALSMNWSNGPTEGHINRLKCLKRQMYGRAKLDLLKQRLCAA